MVNIKLNSKVEKKGTRLAVVFTPDAQESLRELTEKHRLTIADPLARLLKMVEILCERRLRSPEEFTKEHLDFWAIRSLPLRAYGWFQDRCFIISHFIYKDFQKLKAADKQRMEKNKLNYEAPTELITTTEEKKPSNNIRRIK